MSKAVFLYLSTKTFWAVHLEFHLGQLRGGECVGGGDSRVLVDPNWENGGPEK